MRQRGGDDWLDQAHPDEEIHDVRGSCNMTRVKEERDCLSREIFEEGGGP